MKSIDILLIENNEGDIVLTTEALEDSKIINKVNVLRDGEAAIGFFEGLTGNDKYPDLVLLDINLPKISGHEVLVYIKTHARFKSIPVIMLTTSSSDKDIQSSYKNYVNCYITKPIDVSDFMQAIGKIEDFWINIVSMP
jgi:CheY-like chemotaxis protein